MSRGYPRGVAARNGDSARGLRYAPRMASPEQPGPGACRNCGAPLGGPYCSECGQLAVGGRITTRAVLGSAIDALFSLDSRLVRTVLGLTRGPGRVATDYVEGRRARYVAPFRYYVIVLAMGVALASVLGVDLLDASQGLIRSEGIEITSDGDGSGERMRGVIREWLGHVLLLALPILAGLLRVLFPRSGRNYAECYVLALYTAAHAQLLGACLLVFDPLAHELVDPIRKLLPFAWLSWGAVVFYRAPRVTGTLRAVLALLLYTFSALMIVLALAVVLGRG